MRKDLFKAIMAQDMGWFDKHRTGDTMTRLSNDTALIQKALTSNVANGLRSGFMVI
jgi:ATP-binding cassette subfamily B protein